jgi:hypothetical protein
MELAVLGGILLVLVGLLTAVKRGFNEVIKGLESIDRRLDQKRSA